MLLFVESSLLQLSQRQSNTGIGGDIVIKKEGFIAFGVNAQLALCENFHLFGDYNFAAEENIKHE
jgi:hypothetical protein